jgi:DNA invertase Pin-like site-specific DNA recombinase
MSSRVSVSHRQKRAVVYVRQSTAAQVHHHVESKQRQYALAERAVSLGWPRELVETIDEDQGKSGATAEGRRGFNRLADEVAHGRVGAVFALEVSRLARSSHDWQRLLSLCAVADVLVIDEQSIYDPARHDDKLLLDLKGAMSEQELHWLRLRLAGGRLNKARRGEAYVHPPAGYVWTPTGLALDPDESVRRAVRWVFERFTIEPSGGAVLRWARDVGFRIPTRNRTTSEVRWSILGASRLYDMLHNPVYAGVYVFGRRPTRKTLVDGKIGQSRRRLDDRKDWPVSLDDAHPAYITWETYMSNRDKLTANRQQRVDGGAPRRGDALLSGLLLCGRCGYRMGTHYDRGGRWSYRCHRDDGGPRTSCWSAAGKPLDNAVEQLFLNTMVPEHIELGLAVERHARDQGESLDRAWQTRLEQVRYQVRLAERRYMAVDPDNRTVARTLEGRWEDALREAADVDRQYDEARRIKRVQLTDTDRVRIRQLAEDLPAVWRAPTTAVEDRKAMLRIAIEIVALSPVDLPLRRTQIDVQWHSGTTSTVFVARPRRGEYLKTTAPIEETIRALAADGLHDSKIAGELNENGFSNGAGEPWTLQTVRSFRSRRKIPRVAATLHHTPLLPERDAEGWYSVPGAAAHMSVSSDTVRRWIRRGLVTSRRGDHGPHRNVYWLTLDPETEQRLRALRNRRGGRHQKETRPTDSTS